MEVFTVFTADGVTESRAFSSNLLQKWTELSAILQIWAEIYKIWMYFEKGQVIACDYFITWITCPFSKDFRILYIFTHIFKCFALFGLFLNIFYPFLPFFWKITHMPLLSRIDSGFLVMTIYTYCYFGIFRVKCLTPAKISYGKQHFWL